MLNMFNKLFCTTSRLQRLLHYPVKMASKTKTRSIRHTACVASGCIECKTSEVRINLLLREKGTNGKETSQV